MQHPLQMEISTYAEQSQSPCQLEKKTTAIASFATIKFETPI